MAFYSVPGISCWIAMRSSAPRFGPFSRIRAPSQSDFPSAAPRLECTLGAIHAESEGRVFESHYLPRNHQGLHKRLIAAGEEVGRTSGEVRCHKRLGGMIRYCYRDAAQDRLSRDTHCKLEDESWITSSKNWFFVFLESLTLEHSAFRLSFWASRAIQAGAYRRVQTLLNQGATGLKIMQGLTLQIRQRQLVLNDRREMRGLAANQLIAGARQFR